MKKKDDIIIAGTGVAGLYCALNLPEDKQILLITKDGADQSDSFLAQGGICVLKDPEDYESFFEDTLKAGHYENDRGAVDMMISSSPVIIQDLIRFGVSFEQAGGQFLYTREGAHSKARILHHEDLTGKEISGKLLAEVRKRNNIRIQDYTTLLDILSNGNECRGVVVSDRSGNINFEEANYVVLACGGIGGLYESSTNYGHLTGDGIAIAIKNNVAIKDLNYIQIHPTTFYSEKKGRRFLISESVRGEGAILLNKDKERFVDELLPRDLLTEEINKQMEKDKTEYVWLSVSDMGSEAIKKRFPNIYSRCLEEGYDLTKEPIPVTPAQHYLMGGIRVDLDSRTSMDRLYAAGETSCNGVHGANRLASNSLLESLVFAKRAAGHISKNFSEANHQIKMPDRSAYSDPEKIKEQYRRIIFNEIERAEKMNQKTMLNFNADDYIIRALKEDITSEDITTNAILHEAKKAEAELICKQDGVIAGLDVFRRVFELLDAESEVKFNFRDGDAVKKGDLIGILKADARVILSGERTALNFLQRMSGIATSARNLSSLLSGTKTKLLDTRKTTPNMRLFEKYAVKAGGAYNHRYNLSDGILLKDNHIAAAGGVKEAVAMAREYASFVRKIEVEVEDLAMVKDALEAGADIIMLDNMDTKTMKEAISMIGGKAETECSGNVTEERLRELAEIGVDYISCGALTHSSPIMDISLKNLRITG